MHQFEGTNRATSETRAQRSLRFERREAKRRSADFAQFHGNQLAGAPNSADRTLDALQVVALALRRKRTTTSTRTIS